MNSRISWRQVLLTSAIGAMCLALAVVMSAQVQTTKTTTAGPQSHQVQVERAEVVRVSGNDLIVKMEDGTIRHISKVPESARVMVDGKELGIHDLRPGMKLQRTITTTTNPSIITTTQTVTGKIWIVTPPNSLILTLENGENQEFKIPAGQKFMVDGEELDAFHLRKGMKVSATKVVEVPVTAISEKKVLTGTAPPPPPPAADQPILIASAVSVPPPPTPQEPAPQQLPKTGGQLPLLALLGCLSVVGSASSRLLRRVVG